MNTYGRCSQSKKGVNHTIQKKYWFARQKLLERVKKNKKISNGGPISYEAVPTDEINMEFSDATLKKINEFKEVEKFLENHLKIGKDYMRCLKSMASIENILKNDITNITNDFQNYCANMANSACECLEITSKAHKSITNSIQKFNGDLEVFYTKAIQDTLKSVNELNIAKEHLSASFCWMNKVAKNLDPDVNKRITKFKGVQFEVKQQHENYMKMCEVIDGKISLITVSSDNMIIRNITEYHQNLLEHYENSFDSHKFFNEKYKSIHVPYEFKFLRNIIGENNGISMDPSESFTSFSETPISNDPDIVSDLIDLDDSNETFFHDSKNLDDSIESMNDQFFQSLASLSLAIDEPDNNDTLLMEESDQLTNKNVNDIKDFCIEAQLMINEEDKNNEANKDFESKQWDQFFASISNENNKNSTNTQLNFDILLENIESVNRINPNNKNNDYC